MYLENSRFKEFYMDFVFWLGIISLDLFVTSLADLAFLFNSPSNHVLNFFEHCFQRTDACRSVENVEWNSKLQILVFGLNTQQINEERANEEVKKKIIKRAKEKDK